MKYAEAKEMAGRLRRNATPAEKLLWKYLSGRKLVGRKFNRQYIVIYERNVDECFVYIPDFYCFEEKLVIELDGGIHNYQVERDQFRDEILSNYGLRVLHIRNEDLEDISSVLNRIKAQFSDQKIRVRKRKTNNKIPSREGGPGGGQNDKDSRIPPS